MKRIFPVALSISLTLAAAISPDVQPRAFAGPASALSAQIDIAGPPGSEQFGKSVAVLPNGNIVVTDPLYDAGPTANVGAVYLCDGASGTLINTLTGSTAQDQVGYHGVTVLSNGSYIVRSPNWDNGGEADAGAVTLCNGTIGCTGTVSAANSLVGSTTSDQVGYDGVIELNNGSYVVRSPYWDNGTAVDAGAVTWCSGTAGCTGAVSVANSLVGSTAEDRVGGVLPLLNGSYVVVSHQWDNGAVADAGAVTWCSGTAGCTGAVSVANSLVGSTVDDYVGIEVIALSDGNYVVASSSWDDGAVADVGAVTWADGTTGITGTISATNSLVGSTAADHAGSDVVALNDGSYVVRSSNWDNGAVADAGAVTWCAGAPGCTGPVTVANSLVGATAGDKVGLYYYVITLSDGDYVVVSPEWDNGAVVDAGAVTWCSGTAGCTGPVAVTNSLVGSTADDRVGHNGVTELSDGDYVVRNLDWDNGAVVDAGAATWCSGTTGCSGPISAANSLVGSQANDQVGASVTPLTNGHYVVSSAHWDNGTVADAGAVTWGNGAGGTSGVVSSTNSLVGSTADDLVGVGVTPLTNGHYVVGSYFWHNGTMTDAGAVTWCDGTAGCTGPVTASNSLVGSTTDDQVGYTTALNNGHYVAHSPYWDNATMADAGAVTWADGTIGITGAISSANSLVGSTAGDQVGYVAVLDNGNYVVRSPQWDNGAATDAGAATWCSGTTGCTGVISSTNSLVGSTGGDQVAYDGLSVAELSNGSYVVHSRYWDNGAVTDAGAVTWCIGPTGCIGPITFENSVRGTAANGGSSLIFVYDPANFQLVVGRPTGNVVTLFRPYQRVFMPLVMR
jgi:hypothetical protein